jgi:hypothetical protein
VKHSTIIHYHPQIACLLHILLLTYHSYVCSFHSQIAAFLLFSPLTSSPSTITQISQSRLILVRFSLQP